MPELEPALTVFRELEQRVLRLESDAKESISDAERLEYRATHLRESAHYYLEMADRYRSLLETNSTTLNEGEVND